MPQSLQLFLFEGRHHLRRDPPDLLLAKEAADARMSFSQVLDELFGGEGGQESVEEAAAGIIGIRRRRLCSSRQQTRGLRMRWSWDQEGRDVAIGKKQQHQEEQKGCCWKCCWLSSPPFALHHGPPPPDLNSSRGGRRPTGIRTKREAIAADAGLCVCGVGQKGLFSRR